MGFGRVLVEKAAADSFQRACFLKGAPSSRAMASAWLWRLRASWVAEVRNDSSPGLFSAMAKSYREPRSRNNLIASVTLAAAAA